MATLQDVQNAIDAAGAARIVETNAITALGAIETVVNGSLTAEAAAFTDAQTTWNLALDEARELSGFAAALATRDAATLARAQAEIDARAVMQDYITNPT